MPPEASVKYRLVSIGLASLSPLAVHHVVSPKKEVVAAAAAVWLPGLLFATLRDYRHERPGRVIWGHPLAPFAVLYGLAATYGLAWAFARDNDPVLAAGQTFTAALFVLGFAVAGPTLGRHATRGFWLAIIAAVAVLSIPRLVPVLEWALGIGDGSKRFVDPIAVFAPMCMVLAFVLLYPRRATLAALAAGYFALLTLLTFTRSYWLGAAGALVFLAVLVLRGRGATVLRRPRLRPRTALQTLGMAACAALLLVATPVGEYASARLNLDPEQSGDLSIVVRDQELGAALAHVRAHPVAGLGSGGEYLSLHQTSPTTVRFGPTNFVHNAYLYLPLKFGLLGFAALAALLVGTIRVVASALTERSRVVTTRGLYTAVLLLLLLASTTAPNLVDPRHSFLAGAVAWLAGAASRSPWAE